MTSIFHQFARGVSVRAPVAALAFGLVFGAGFAAHAEDAAPATTNQAKTDAQIEYATPSKLASKDLLLAATMAGKRLIAVGEFGHVIYSDDGGTNWIQAAKVPTQVTLTSVFFLTDKIGYAGGHDSTVLKTEDGGDNWTLAYHNETSQAPIMSVYFENENHGFAMGAFSFVIETEDGGKTWNQRPLMEGVQEDSHLNKIFGTKAGTILVAAEFGTVYRSTDHGKTFAPVKTGYEGSFWGGMTLKDGAALIYGMRGNVYRSTDDGETWARVNSGTDKSVSGGTELDDGSVVLVGLQGYVGYSTDHGLTFTEVTRADRLGYASVLPAANNQVAVFGEPGVKIQPDTAAKAADEVGFKFDSGS